MNTLLFDADKKFTYHWCGKFVAPNDSWIHMTRGLNDYELMVVIKGTLYIASDDTKYTVGENEYLLMPPTKNQHGFKESDCSFYWLHFSYDEDINDHMTLAGEVSYVPGIISLLETGRLSSIERVIILIKQLMDSDRRYRETTLNNSLTLAVLSEIAAEGKALSDNGKLHKKEQTYNDIRDYISWHISEPIKISDIAAYFGYNEKYLTTFFRKHSGISLKQYVLNEKIEKAKVMLSESDASVSETAYSLGWNDAHNFSNAFKNQTGLSPISFRESYNIHNVFPV